MKPFWIFLGITIIFLFPLSCKEDRGGVSPEVEALYRTNGPLKPLPEYTMEKPREWENIADEHVPDVRLSRLTGKDAIMISVSIEKPTMQHYVEKIGIMDENNKEIVSETILRKPNPKTWAYFLIEDLPVEKKGLKAFIKCNLHDMWTTPLDEELFKK